ncbi:hypothetical protein GCM10009827_074710 [Dactylosporangium maewongense]|uniref:DUF1877 family protein n=1 Tax=Dactylosporangium maewongense TaxID=634393 RepID=A0ABN2BMK5_9ACTN
MGVMYDYFAAGSDERAATVLDLPAGPGGPLPAVPGLMDRVRAGDMAALQELRTPRVRWGEHGFQVLEVKGLDPIVTLATLEELITGVAYDDIVEGPRAGADIASADDGERMVVTVTDELQQALARCSPDELARAAAAWARTEELGGDDDVEPLTVFLGELAILAREALGRGERLYCWVCV